MVMQLKYIIYFKVPIFNVNRSLISILEQSQINCLSRFRIGQYRLCGFRDNKYNIKNLPN